MGQRQRAGDHRRPDRGRRLSLRPARPDDAAAVCAIVAAAYAPWVAVIGRRPAPMDADYAARIAAGQVQVIAPAGVVQAAMVTWRTGDALHLDMLAVAPEAQGKGLGQQLIAAAEAQARTLGLRRLDLYTNAAMTSNIALYLRLGFRETRRGRDAGFHRVYFTKDLHPAQTGR